MDKGEKRLAEKLLVGIPEQTAKSAVDSGEKTLQIAHANQVRGEFEDLQSFFISRHSDKSGFS